MTIIKPDKRLVYGDGLLDSAKICFVGEAPGTEEVKRGIGFVGPSGSLLWHIAGQHGISRHDAYVTNVVKEQPPGNDVSKFIIFKGGRATPTPAYKEYEEYLHQEIAAFKGNVIVAVGGVALWALARRIGITKWRGSILEAANGKKVIPILHPASAMRQYIYTHLISFDLGRVREEMEFPELRLPSRIIHVEPSFNEIIQYLLRASQYPMVGVDIEVLGTEISCISVSISPQETMSIPFIRSGRDYLSLEQEVQVWVHLANLLKNPNVVKIFQNGVFDFTFIFRRYGIQIRPVVDTMIGQAIAFPDFPKGLDFITSIHTREPYYKDEGKKWFRMGGSERDFWIYNAKDSAVAHESWPRILQMAEKQNNVSCVARQTALIEPLVYMHTRGMRVDKEGLDRESAEAGEKITKLTSELRAKIGYDINPNSPPQLQEFFYTRKREKPYLDRKTGRPTVDINALKRLVRKGHEEAKIILDIRKLTKLKSTYLDVVIDIDGRLRCAFNPVGTKFGRLSSSEDIFGVGTNTQNLPPEFKKFVIADSDCLIFEMDLSQAENRAVAYIAPEPAMIEAFESKIDIHRQTASLIFGKPIEVISDEKGSSTIGSGDYSERFWGKKANHGLNYDLGYKTFAFYYEIQEAEAKFIVERYHTAYPGVRSYHAWVRDRLANGRTLVNLYGRHCTFLGRWGDELFKEAYAFMPQSTVADKINTDGLIYIWDHKGECRPIDLLNQVHDSILFQINMKAWAPEDIGRAVLAIKKSLETQLEWRGKTFSIPVDLAVGINCDKESMKKVKIDADESPAGLAKRLHEVYVQFRASSSL